MMATFPAIMLFFLFSCVSAPESRSDVDAQIQRNEKAQALLDHTITVLNKSGLPADKTSEITSRIDAAKIELLACSKQLKNMKRETDNLTDIISDRDSKIKRLEVFATIGKWIVGIIGVIMFLLLLTFIVRITGFKIPIPGGN